MEYPTNRIIEKIEKTKATFMKKLLKLFKLNILEFNTPLTRRIIIIALIKLRGPAPIIFASYSVIHNKIR